MNRCVVKGCGTNTPPNIQLCQRCFTMLSRGVLMQSTAWFATELEFLNTQNYHAMEQVRQLHDKVNELMEEK